MPRFLVLFTALLFLSAFSSTSKEDYMVEVVKTLDANQWSMDTYKSLLCDASVDTKGVAKYFDTFAQAGGIREIVKVENTNLPPTTWGPDVNVTMLFNKPVYMKMTKKESIVRGFVGWRIGKKGDHYCLEGGTNNISAMPAKL